MAEPKFEPKTGQIDYTHIRWAPVVNCVVESGGKILLVQRSKDMRLYPSYWNGISGFLDDNKSLEEKVREELREELDIQAEHIMSITLGQIFDQDAPEYNKTWIVHPVLVKVNKAEVWLDWEADKYKWVTVTEARQMDLLPGFELVLDKLFGKAVKINPPADDIRRFQAELPQINTFYWMYRQLYAFFQENKENRNFNRTYGVFIYTLLKVYGDSCVMSCSKFFDRTKGSVRVNDIINNIASLGFDASKLSSEHKRLFDIYTKHKIYRDKVVAHMDNKVDAFPKTVDSISQHSFANLPEEFGEFLNDLESFVNEVECTLFGVENNYKPGQRYRVYPMAVVGMNSFKELILKDINFTF